MPLAPPPLCAFPSTIPRRPASGSFPLRKSPRHATAPPPRCPESILEHTPAPPASRSCLPRPRYRHRFIRCWFLFSPKPRPFLRRYSQRLLMVVALRRHAKTCSDRHRLSHKLENGQSEAIMPSNSSDRSDRSDKPLDQKTLRRLAQNREAARKSRLRKKAYVQQLESSKLKLAQLEQELQKAHQQGIFISSSGDQTHAMSGNGALTFDIEYARWLEEQNKQINELRTAVNAHASDSDLRLIVDGIMAHYDEIFKVKGVAAKADVFHILSGMWKTPAERCFLWLGGFRPSELLKLLANHIEPLTEQQLLGLTNLQQSSQQAEDALSQGMEALQQSLAETLAGSLGPSGSSGNVANYMGQMAMAMGKLGTLENFLRQADNLRQQTLHQMQRILTIRQASRALLGIHDYFSRLRALSSLWLARPRE
ncbi:transcription factor TGA2.1 isoform X1 [Phragmites australis]|uniref:transcription factor TGA2.1 isoform X1 n=1 Tax=Phragmites australis TaxID=29695 RepID=UPI002D793AB4|nr:transcription factor TGA2.1 isoform X1 [Phragmites australis]